MKKLVVVLFVSLLMLAGCSSKQSGPKDGTYKGTGSGIAGDVTVEITVESGAIKSCTVDVSGETASYGGAHQADYEDMIVKANGGEIDAIAGCTFTSNGIKEAYAAALEEAGFTK